MLRHDVSTTAADTRLADLLDRLWRRVWAGVCAVAARLRRHQDIHVRDVSDEWLASHSAESGKHADNR